MSSLNEEQQRAVSLHHGRVCVIAGAGSGKCITGDSMVLTDEGLDRIDYASCPSDDEKESIKRTKRIVLSHTMKEEVATHWHKVRASSVVHITTASGYELTGTPEHRIKILNNNGNLGWATLDTLSPDSVCAMALSSLYGTRNLGDLGYLLGLLVGDGCLSLAGGTVGFAKNHPAIEAEYRRILGSAFGITKVTTRRKPGTNSVTHTFHSVAAKQELKKLGLKMVTAPFKEVPTCVLEADKKSQIKFIHGLFDTDAGVHAATLEYSTASETLGRQVQLLFLNMGMRINRSLKVVNGKSYWRLQLMGEALRKFHTDIGFGLAHEKQLKLIQAVSSAPNTNRDIIYHQANRFKRLRQHMQKESWWDGHEQAVTHPPMSLKDYFSGKRNPSRQRCDKICKLLPQDDPDVQQLRFLSKHFWFDPIKTVEIVDGDRFVYDLTVNQSHSYVANGFVNHNTRVLVERVADMIESGISPHDILAFTFTKKAAVEMQERIEKSIGPAVFELTVGTIHSVFWHILQEYPEKIPGYGRGMAIMRDWQQRKIIKDIHEENRLSAEDPMACRLIIGNAKNRLLHTGNEFCAWLESKGFIPKMISYLDFVYVEYERRKRNERIIDFDDMLMLTHDLFKRDEAVLRQWQSRWNYISVDEYQDINPVQEALIDMLSAEHGNLFVVGDARQCVTSDTTIILRGDGATKASRVVKGDMILSASGKGGTQYNEVTAVHERITSEPILHVHTKGGRLLSLTPGHTCFAKLPHDSPDFYVYLMWKDGLGFRVGKTNGRRWTWNGKKGSGLMGRCTQENADAMWILDVVPSGGAALRRELEISTQYGIPQTMFKPRGLLDEAGIKSVFALSAKHADADGLLKDYMLSFAHPHYRPHSVTVENAKRASIRFAAFSGKRSSARVTLETSDPSIHARTGGWRKAKKGLRIEQHRQSYADGMKLAEDLSAATGLPIRKSAQLCCAGESFTYQPAHNLRRGMIIPVYTANGVGQDEIDYVKVEDGTSQTVYDFDVAETHNFFAGGVCVHNSIYAFRASDPGFILNFNHKYPDAQVVRMDRNYRCGEEILTHANRLIANNDEGVEPMVCESGEVGEVSVMSPWGTNEDEAEAVAEQIDTYQGDYKDIAVLYRCNHQSRAVEDAMIHHSIPYEIIGSEGFYGRAEIRDMVAYIEVAAAMDELKDWSFFERIVNKPTRYLGKAFLAEWAVIAKRTGPIACLDSHYASVNRRSVSNVTNLKRDLVDLNRMLDSPTTFLQHIRVNMHYDEWFLENRSGEEMEEIEALSNLNEFGAACSNFNSVPAMLNYIRDVQRRNEKETNGNRVKLMSLHRAKGLEFPVVFVTGMSDVLLPHARSEDLHEERRLMYVGATRAKRKLTLSYYMTHRNTIVGPSPFFAEMGFLIDPEFAAENLDAALDRHHDESEDGQPGGDWAHDIAKDERELEGMDDDD